MKLNFFGIVTILTFLIIATACKKEEETIVSTPPILLITDNTTYIPLDVITFTIQNETENSIQYAACGNSINFDYEVEKRDGGEWVSVGGFVCPGFSWVEIPANSIQTDTLSANALDKGDYRIKMQLIIESNSTIMYSNLFNLK